MTVAYNQWTEFGAFPSFMKKVENVEAEDDNKLNFKAQIFWSPPRLGGARSSSRYPMSGSSGVRRARRATSTAR